MLRLIMREAGLLSPVLLRRFGLLSNGSELRREHGGGDKEYASLQYHH
jgi:hypothetical protein